MHILFVLACVSSVAFGAGPGFTDEEWTKLQKIHQDCIDDSKIDEAIVTKAKEEGVFEDDPKLTAFFLCFFKGQGFITDAGEYQPDAIKAKLLHRYDEDIVDKFVSECIKEKSDDINETAIIFAKCYRAQRHKYNR